MKKIEFGFNTSMEPTDYFEGIGLNEIENGKCVGMTGGKLIGILNHNGNYYLINEVSECFGSNPDILGTISVRNAITKEYPDNSTSIFIDLKKSDHCNYLEEWLNDSEVRSKINTIKDVRDITEYYDEVPDEFYIALDNDIIYVTGINHEVFLELKDKTNSRSM